MRFIVSYPAGWPTDKLQKACADALLGGSLNRGTLTFITEADAAVEGVFLDQAQGWTVCKAPFLDCLPLSFSNFSFADEDAGYVAAPLPPALGPSQPWS